MQAHVSYHGNQLTMFFSRQGKNGLNEQLWGLFIELLKKIETVFEGFDEMELLE